MNEDKNENNQEKDVQNEEVNNSKATGKEDKDDERIMENIESKSDFNKDGIDKELMMNEEAFVNIVIRHENKSIKYELSKDIDSWTSSLFTKLCSTVKTNFNLSDYCNFIIYDKINGTDDKIRR